MATATAPTKSMPQIVALCKRRGFVFPASEIYGGINGFWDFGPLGTQLKNNLRDAWWQEMVRCPPAGPEGEQLEILGLDSAIIQNPRVWEASGHVRGFSDPMVDDKETKQRFRADHLCGLWAQEMPFDKMSPEQRQAIERGQLILSRMPLKTLIASTVAEAAKAVEEQSSVPKPYKLTSSFRPAPWNRDGCYIADAVGPQGTPGALELELVGLDDLKRFYDKIKSPFTGKAGSLTEPRQFNLMFLTYVGALQDEESKAYLRPETAQGIFVNYKSVLDTMRVKIPFGIAQIGKAFRNEVTPRNFIYRAREFEQMEMEWFCRPADAPKWFAFWQARRLAWWRSMGLGADNLRVRPHGADELSHYARGGSGTVDIEYRFPFTDPDFAELEGIAHRTDFDLKAHQTQAGIKLEYFDQEQNARYLPHVVEPAAGLSRGVLAVLCEAYTPDPERPSKVYMRFHPQLAPIQAAIFPLVAKDGMPEVAGKLYRELRGRFTCRLDIKQSIGKRYARMDEAGTPYCFTVDGQTLSDQSVTVRNRDTAAQERIGIDHVADFLAERIKA